MHGQDSTRSQRGGPRGEDTGGQWAAAGLACTGLDRPGECDDQGGWSGLAGGSPPPDTDRGSDNFEPEYDDGDLISNAAKITSELSLNWRDSGAFARATYFYDFENADRNDLSETAKDLIGERFTFVDRAWQLKQSPAEARVPWRIQQVIDRVRARAAENGIPPELAEALWRQMIGWFIQYEEERLQQQNEKGKD